MVEASLKEVDHGVIEAAISMGAGTGTVIWKVLLAEARTSLLVGVTIATGTVLGYSAMAGVVGGGGLGILRSGMDITVTRRILWCSRLSYWWYWCRFCRD